MVGSDIRTEHPEVAKAISQWKRMWEVATFGSDDDYENQVRGNSSCVQDILDDFGPEVVLLGRNIWAIQAQALSKAPFIAEGSGYPRTARQ